MASMSAILMTDTLHPYEKLKYISGIFQFDKLLETFELMVC